MTTLCYLIDKFVVNVACDIVASDALRCTSAPVILSLAKYLMNNKAEFLTKYNKEHKSLKSHQQHEKSTNIKVILNIIFIIMLMVQGIPVGVFNHLLNNKTET